jgi:PPOX class probable F420-dependent enzyme
MDATATQGSAAMNAQTGFGALRFKRYLSLETYRKNGKAVRTPVWFAVAPRRGDIAAEPKIYAYTTEDSGKAKRIRNCGVARIAACNAFGRITGSWFEARVEIVSGEEAKLGMRLINWKYIPVKQILDLLALFGQPKRIMLAIRLERTPHRS